MSNGFGGEDRESRRPRRGARRGARFDDATERPRSAMPTSALAGGGPRGGRRASAPVAVEDTASAPARVTAIEAHGRKAGRFTIRLEGAPAATVSVEIVDRLALRVGAVLAVPQLVALRDAAAALATYDRALNLLATRARSSAELRRKLVEKGEQAALADRAIEKLQGLGLLDDEAYARQVARGKLLGGASKRRVQQELWRRGVGRELADDAVAEVVADEAVDETEAAETVARRKVASLAKLDVPTRRRRLYAFLARRGYDHQAIRAALAVVLRSGEVDELDTATGDADAVD